MQEAFSKRRALVRRGAHVDRSVGFAWKRSREESSGNAFIETYEMRCELLEKNASAASRWA